MLFLNILQYQVVVVNNFSDSKNVSFESMQNDLEKGYSSSSNAVREKKRKHIDLLGE